MIQKKAVGEIPDSTRSFLRATHTNQRSVPCSGVLPFARLAVQARLGRLHTHFVIHSPSASSAIQVTVLLDFCDEDTQESWQF